jgi:UDP-N-acetylmuramate--alanine ligase
MTQSPQTQLNGWQDRVAAGDPTLHVHLMGIGGAGLSAIAAVLLEQGMTVSGSDRQPNEHTKRLAAAGAQIFTRQEPENLAGMAPDVVLISSAIGPENGERAAAEERGLPVVKRAEFLPALLERRKLIAIAGAHGKSTTTAMIVKTLRENGIDAGYIIGTQMAGYGNAAAGSAAEFVLEADEYDRMFLGLNPAIAVITNVEWDHPDCYPTPASFRRAFMQFVDSVQRDGLIISCLDDPGAEQLHAYSFSRGPEWLTYGLHERADLRATNLQPRSDSGYLVDLTWWNAPAGALDLRVPGVHNVQNAMAALLVGRSCGLSLAAGAATLSAFTGTARRFERKGEAAGVTVIDDYAHHPTEVEMTLAAARHRFPDRRIWAVFQPHTFSRTGRMLYRMGDSFGKADRVIVTDIYAAREVDDGSVSAAELVAASEHPAIEHMGGLEAVAAYLSDEVEPGDVVITLGAGDGYRIGEMLLAALASRLENEVAGS